MTGTRTQPNARADALDAASRGAAASRLAQDAFDATLSPSVAPHELPPSARTWHAVANPPLSRDAGAFAGLLCVLGAWGVLFVARYYGVHAPDTTMPFLLAVAIACALGARAGLTAGVGSLAFFVYRLWPFLSEAGAGRTAALWRLGWFGLGVVAICGAFAFLRWREGWLRAQMSTVRRELWSDLQQSETREAELRRALEAVADGVVICDPTGTVTFANPEARRLHGFDARGAACELSRETRYLSLDGRPFPASSVPLSRAIKGETVEGVEWRIRRGDNSEVVAQGAARPVLNAAGRALGAIMTLRDQSAHKRALAELQHSNQVKTQFLGVLSHELRTPLTPILGWVTLLRGPNAALLKDAEAVGGALEAIERNAMAQKRLIDDLIDAISLLSGGLTLSPSPSLVSGTLHKAVDELTSTAQLRGITFRVECDEVLPPLLLDEARFSQALRHLLSNAIKFSRDDGLIQVRARYARDISLPGQEVPPGVELAGVVTIDVIDSGEGIAPDVLPWVFEMFRQGDGSATRKHGGLGVGLTLARALIELHGGDLSAHSEGEGRGARFTIALPVPA